MNRRTGKSSFITIIIFIGDVTIINLLFIILHSIRAPWLLDLNDAYFRHELLALNFSYFPVYFMIKDQHKQRIFEVDRLMRLAFYTVTFHFIIFYFLINFLDQGMVSIRFIVSYFTLLFILIIGWWFTGRELIKIYRLKGYNYRTVVILGAGVNGFELAQKISKDPTFGFRLLGYFDDNPKVDTGGVPLLGKIDDVIDFCENNNIDEIFCALPSSEGEKIMKILDYAERNLIRFFIVPAYYTYLKRRVELHTLSGIPFISLFNEPLENDLNRLSKRIFDIVFSLIILLTIFPFIYILTGLAIRLSSPGPIFFKQERTGLQGNNFVCLKFRTMRVNKNSDKEQAKKDDPRKTRVGNFLRKSNIDEVPQFINVLKGEMSVVGPRPHMLKHTKDYSALIDKYMIRHLVKPGVTGWAQVNGFRGETQKLEQMEGRVKMDMWYIENWTLWLDLKIIVKTMTNMFKGEKNAY